MAKSDRRAKDAATAAFMAKHPNSFPDSIMKNGNVGEGAGIRAMAKGVGYVSNTGSHHMRGMLGGVLAHKLGYHTNNIPAEYLN